MEVLVKVHEAYHRIFDTPDGELVLEDMKKAHHVYDSSFNPQFPDLTVFNEGERNAVLRITAILNTKPGQKEEKDG
jgi:hypothetical protein